MTRQFIDLCHNWGILVYHGVNKTHGKELRNALENLGATAMQADRAIEVIATPNTGFTYSNPDARMSMVAIAQTTSEDEYINTIAHECVHVLSAICRYYDIDEHSEDAAYLMGFIVSAMHQWVK